MDSPLYFVHLADEPEIRASCHPAVERAVAEYAAHCHGMLLLSREEVLKLRGGALELAVFEARQSLN